MTLVVEEDVERMLGVHHVVRETHAVEPARAEDHPLVEQGALEEVSLLVLAAITIPEDKERARVIPAERFQRSLKL